MPSGLGSHLRRLRRQAGLTQQQAADLAGLSVAALRDLEQGRVDTPRSPTLRRLAEALWLPAAEAEELIRRGQPDRLPADDLWLQVLGPVTARVNGVRVELGSPRRRMLLAALALTANAPVGRDRLIELIWGSRPPANAAELLRIDASRLRRRLRAPVGVAGAPVVGTGNGYQLTVADNQLDLLLFRRLADQARHARKEGDPHRACRLLAEATGLWGSDPLADLAPARADPAVAGLLREWQATVVDYAETATMLGRHREVLPLLRQVVDADPMHESASAQLLVGLTAAGQAATATRIYERLRRRLAEDFGADPGPQLLQAHRAARRRDAGSPPVVKVRRGIPRDLPDFVGRAEELAWLDGRLAASASRRAPVTLVIVGPAGVGKTRLAVHFAHRMLTTGIASDLQIHAELQNAEPAATLAAMLGTLGVAQAAVPPDLPGRAALYRHSLAHRSAVVLLDDAVSEAQVLPLLPAGRDNLVLVTSRRALALDGAQVLVLDNFAPPDAHRLLARIVGGQRVADDPAGAARLAAQCGHLPLAVSLAAHRLRARRSWHVADLTDRLARAPDLLSELAAGSDLLRAVFDRSVHSLNSAERRLLRLLGEQPDGELAIEAAARLAGLPPMTAGRVLDRLADEHLVVPLAAGRYRLGGLLRDYVRSLPH